MGGTVLFKVGGSLLDWPGLPAAISRLLFGLTSMRVAIVVGGGKVADVVREWDLIYPLSSEQAHWLAIDAMDLTARLLQSILPDSELVADQEQLERTWHNGRVAILLPKAWMEQIEFAPEGLTLPHDWSVTSDSIALRLAAQISATRCVLVKSVAYPSGVNSSEWASEGYIDPYFFDVAGMFPQIQLGWINLRHMEPMQMFVRPITQWGNQSR